MKSQHFKVHRRYIVNTLPQHLIPKRPTQNAPNVSANTLVDPRYGDRRGPNPFLKFNQIYQAEKKEYDLPLAVQWSNILKISKNSISKILEQYPILLSLSNNLEQVIQTSQYLTKKFGSSESMRKMFLKEPRLILYTSEHLEERINIVINLLFDNIGNNNFENNSSSEKKPKTVTERKMLEDKIKTILDLICRQPTILCENELTMHETAIPRLLLLTKYLTNDELILLLVKCPDVITMHFSRLIRIVFYYEMKKFENFEKFPESSENGKDNVDNINNDKDADRVLRVLNEVFDICDMNEVKLNHLESEYFQSDSTTQDILKQVLIEMRKCDLWIILQWDSVLMQRVFGEYNKWLFDKINSNFYVNPLSYDLNLLIDENGLENNKYKDKLLNMIDCDINNDEIENEHGDKTLLIGVEPLSAATLTKDDGGNVEYSESAMQVGEIQSDSDVGPEIDLNKYNVDQLEHFAGEAVRAQLCQNSVLDTSPDWNSFASFSPF